MTELLPAVSITMLMLTWFSWQAARSNSTYRAAVMVLWLSFGYWYFVPALNALAIGFEADQIEAGRGDLENALLASFLFFGCALGALWLMFSTIRLQAPASSSCSPDISDTDLQRRTQVLGLVGVLSSAGLLASRFGADGTELILRILTGETSARANMEFYNVSSGILSSMDGLWEIINITLFSLLLCICVIARNNLGHTRMLAISGLLVMFMASGTRSIFLYAIVATLTAKAIRPQMPQIKRTKSAGRFGLSRLIVVGFVIAGAVGAVVSFGSRFENYEFGMTSAVLGLFLSHNDMLRELAVVLERLPLYQNVTPADFALTPFTFLLPRFLGFDKDIPEHLVIYNLDRMGIDIRVDPGNYFPGIVGDFVAVFGPLGGALAFSAFACAVTLGSNWLANQLRGSRYGQAVAAVTLALLFISFRNIPGSFALSAIIALILGRLLVRSNSTSN